MNIRFLLLLLTSFLITQTNDQYMTRWDKPMNFWGVGALIDNLV